MLENLFPFLLLDIILKIATQEAGGKAALCSSSQAQPLRHVSKVIVALVIFL